jgi:hypothetical protein
MGNTVKIVQWYIFSDKSKAETALFTSESNK